MKHSSPAEPAPSPPSFIHRCLRHFSTKFSPLCIAHRESLKGKLHRPLESVQPPLQKSSALYIDLRAAHTTHCPRRLYPPIDSLSPRSLFRLSPSLTRYRARPRKAAPRLIPLCSRNQCFLTLHARAHI